MAPVIRTHGEVARWIAIQTAYTAAFIVPATAAACLWLFGGDLSRAIGGWEAMWFCLGLALAETLAFTPLVAIRSVETLRQLNLARDELDRLSGVDPLTGLLNRRGFEKAAAALAAAPETRGAPVAALVCDVDRFKQINDGFGHDFGDAGLQRLADMLRSAAGDRGFALGRHGGDEFVALMVGVERREAVAFAEALRATMTAQPVEANDARAVLTVSVGLAATARWEGDVARLVGAADAALYQAKREGRNRVVVASESLCAAA
jgi:diguanylate cyclase (GGDEF)-like protein